MAAIFGQFPANLIFSGALPILVTGVHVFLAARNSSRTTVVGRSVGPSVRPSVMFVKKWPLERQKIIKTYLLTYLWDSSDSCDSCDICDSNDSNDSNDSSDSSYQTTLWLTFCD